MARHVWDTTAAEGLSRWLFYAPEGDEAALRRWLPGAARYCRQATAEDLGQRLSHAFSLAFDAGASRVAVIGTDLPGLTGGLLEEAFDALESDPAVLGPSADGGFWLLGLRKPVRADFSGVEWGTPRAAEGMLRNLRSAGLSVAMAQELVDVDTEDDLRLFPALVALADSIREIS
jgi:rSAM/selenodomain-associated transferase 1